MALPVLRELSPQTLTQSHLVKGPQILNTYLRMPGGQSLLQTPCSGALRGRSCGRVCVIARVFVKHTVAFTVVALFWSIV
jgi:hypothetical protein